MLFNPFAKVEVRMVVTIMINLGKIMMDCQGRPKGHHHKEHEGEGYGYPQPGLIYP